MGDHYTPQKYLRGFCDADGKIWVYDRVRKNTFRTTLVNVAQENGFYSPEDERDLNQFVEMPANYVLDKLRDRTAITLEDRDKLALYIATFIYRVPYNRALGETFATPQAWSQFIDRIVEEMKTKAAAIEMDAEKLARKLEQVEEVRKKYADKPTEAIQDHIRSPWPGEQVCRAVKGMKWRLFSTSGPSFYLTSDNPAFFFQSVGLGQDISEISFPISTDLLLHGCWQHVDEGEIVPIQQKLVKEMNRRTASKSTRFLFYHKKESWVTSLGDNAGGHRLNRIQGDPKSRLKY